MHRERRRLPFTLRLPLPGKPASTGSFTRGKVLLKVCRGLQAGRGEGPLPRPKLRCGVCVCLETWLLSPLPRAEQNPVARRPLSGRGFRGKNQGAGGAGDAALEGTSFRGRWKRSVNNQLVCVGRQPLCSVPAQRHPAALRGSRSCATRSNGCQPRHNSHSLGQRSSPAAEPAGRACCAVAAAHAAPAVP